MSTQIQGIAQFQDLRQDTAFQAAPPVEQIQYLQEVYLPQQDPEFAKAPIQEQQQYIQEVVLPQIKQTEVMPAHGSLTQTPQWMNELPDELGYAAATTALPWATAGKAITGDYLDLEAPLLDYARGVEQKYPEAFQNDPRRIDSPYSKAGRAVSYGAGMMKNMQMIGGGLKAGAKALGQNMLPKTTQYAQAAGVGSNFHRAMMNAATWMQSRGFGPSAFRMGAELGLYEGLKSQPGHQLDLGQRAMHGLGGAVTGGAFGAAGEAVAPLIGRAVKGAGEAIGELPYMLDDLKPVNLNMPRVPKRILDANNRAQQMLRDLYEGAIDAAHVDMEDIKSLGTVLDDLQYVIENGLGQKTQKNLAERANAVVGRIKVKAKARSKFDVKKAEAKQQNGPKQQPTEGTKPGEQATEPSKSEGQAVKEHSPFADIPSRLQSNPNVVGYVSKAIANTAGTKEGPIVISGNVIKHIRKHLKDFLDLGAGDSKEYLQAIIRNTDEAYATGKNKITLVVKDGKGHIAPIEFVNSGGEYRYKPLTAFSPESFTKKYSTIKTGKLLWRRSKSPGLPDQQSSLHAPNNLGSDGQRTANGQSSYSQDSTPKSTPQPPTQLTGSVKEMVGQVAESVDFPANAGEMTAGQLEKELGRKMSQGEKDIHTSLRAIARTEVVDEARGIHKQLPVDSPQNLKFDGVKDSISPEFQKDAQIIDDAMAQGKAVRVEYVAEASGRSNEAAKITNTGNVKVDTTTFTPLYWGKTKDGKVLLKGYNQRGHFTTYHLEPSLDGSQILKAGKITDKAFIGEYANIYLGPRPFLAKDILSRGVRSEAGPVKTSDAFNMMKEATNNLDKIFKLIDDPKLPPEAKRMLTELRDKPKWTPKDLKRLQMWINKPEFRNAVCNILGLTHGRM